MTNKHHRQAIQLETQQKDRRQQHYEQHTKLRLTSVWSFYTRASQAQDNEWAAYDVVLVEDELQ